MYSRQLYVYPFLLSARTNAFIPHLVGFFGEVLDEGQSALESNHRLVDGQLAGGVVGFLKVSNQGVKEWSDFEEGIVTWLTLLDIVAVVI